MAIRDYTAESLLFRSQAHAGDPGLLLNITPEAAGWEFISFQVRRRNAGEIWQFSTVDEELAIVTLAGTYRVATNHGDWNDFGARPNVFAGTAHTLYLPRGTNGTVTAVGGGEFAVARVPCTCEHQPFLVRPQDVKTFIRGGDNATRQINQLIPPGAAVQRLVVVEVYTPAGSWSSYPPHKHDVHRPNPQGGLDEADLEEVYYFKINRSHGFAFQHIYTDQNSPLHRQGHPIDAVVKVSDGEAVIVPEGYHPVASPPGYTTYYLNVLAGSAQSLACVDDPAHAWIKESYQTLDSRVPMYPLSSDPILEK